MQTPVLSKVPTEELSHIFALDGRALAVWRNWLPVVVLINLYCHGAQPNDKHRGGNGFHINRFSRVHSKSELC